MIGMEYYSQDQTIAIPSISLLKKLLFCKGASFRLRNPNFDCQKPSNLPKLFYVEFESDGD